MMSAAADVKPERTGWESSRVTKPILKRPMASCRTPQRKNVAMASSERANECTRERERERGRARESDLEDAAEEGCCDGKADVLGVRCAVGQSCRDNILEGGEENRSTNRHRHTFSESWYAFCRGFILGFTLLVTWRPWPMMRLTIATAPIESCLDVPKRP
jgi:hypothetical protein